MNSFRSFFQFCLLVATLNSNAQNFLSGYIIKSNGDSVRGQINYKNWERNPKTISFHSANSTIEQIFTTDQLREFDITGQDHYLKATIQKDMRPVNYDASEDDINSSSLASVKDTVFLRQLVKGGKISLYELIDSKTHYFIQKRGEEIQELQYRIALRKEQSGYTQLFIFRDQLKAMFPTEANAIAAKIERAQYSARDLQKIVELLNGQTTVRNDNAGKGSRFFGGVGISYNSIDFPISYHGMDALKTKDYLGYHFTLGMDLLSHRNLQNLFIRIGLAYSSYHYKGSGERVEYMYQQQKRYSYDLKINSFTPSLSIGYAVLRSSSEKPRPYLAMGLGYNLSSYPNNVYKEENLTLNEEETISNIFLYEKNWLEVAPRIGVIYHQMDFSLSSKLLGSFANFSTWKPKQKLLSLTVARLF